MTEDRPQWDTLSSGSGDALQVDMLAEVMQATWQAVEELTKLAAKRVRRKETPQ